MSSGRKGSLNRSAKPVSGDRDKPGTAAATRERGRKPSRQNGGGRRRALLGYVTYAATLVGLITGIAGLIFLVRPELQPKPSTPKQPPAKLAARLKQLVVRPGVSRAQYFALTDQAPIGFTRPQLAKTGVFLRFRVTIRGFEGLPLTLRRELFDASTGDEVTEESSITITPPKSTIERDWHDWAPLPERRGRFFVVIKLLAKGEAAPLATLQTSDFASGRI